MMTRRRLRTAAIAASMVVSAEVVHLARAGEPDAGADKEVLVDLGFRGDLSCLKDGKTRIDSSISLADARSLQQFIARQDKTPITVIERRPTKSDPHVILVGTGLGCRLRLGGGGSYFTISRDSKGWQLVKRVDWAS